MADIRRPLNELTASDVSFSPRGAATARGGAVTISREKFRSTRDSIPRRVDPWSFPSSFIGFIARAIIISLTPNA